MKWSLEVLKRGMGPYAIMRQPAVTQGLNDLRDRVREAQSAMNRDQAAGKDLEAALRRVEGLREQLEQLKGSSQGRSQPGQQGQQSQPGQQPGEQHGQQGKQGKQGQEPGQQPGELPSATGSTGRTIIGSGSPDVVFGTDC